MTDTKEDLVQQRDRDSPVITDINDDIIDVSALDFGHPDTWLQRPSQDFLDDGIRDIRAWLKNDTEQDCNNSHDNKRSIDTRTFTRPKKRLGRLSFESIVETNVPTSSNVWNQASTSISTKKAYKNDAEHTRHEEESVPHMLRPSLPRASNSFSTNSALTSGQESLEAFLNMSQSKAIDSFIDLVEPEFNEDLMETSQPSLLYSSVTSVINDDTSVMMNHSMTLNQSQITRQSGIEDSQILTESMMETSLFRDVVDVNFNDTFAKNSLNVTVLENTSFCSPADTTFLATAVTTSTGTFNSTFNHATFNSENIETMNATYTPSRLNLTMTNDPHASYIVHRDTSETQNLPNFDATFEKTPASSAKKSSSKLAFDPRPMANDVPTIMNERLINETFRAPSCEKIPAMLNDLELASQTKDLQNFDATFEKSSLSLPRKASMKSMNEFRPMANDVATVTNEPAINETFRAPSCEKIFTKLAENFELMPQTQEVQNFDVTFEKSPLSPRKSSIKLSSQARLTTNELPTMINETFKAPSCEKISTKLAENFELATQTHEIQNFDATFEKLPLSPRKSSIKLSSQARLTTNEVPTMINETFKAPSCEKMSTKLAENFELATQTHEIQNFDATFEKLPLSPRKSSIKLSLQPRLTTNEVPTMINETFKAPSCEIISAKLNDQVDPLSRGGSLDNLDTTFCKPAPKIPRQLSLPRPLSRLPQSLQKSNPNLGSNNLKTSNTITRSGIPSLGLNKPPRPSTARNVESSLSSKLYGFGRMKSGSEQRLEETRNSTELQSMGTGGSTESIESTQSAHSAPDFDDRLSVRSDGSGASYSMRTMNIDEFQKIVRMQGECLKQESTPKPGRTVLENNWVTASNDLPSPILKNTPDTYGSRGSSPRSTDSTVKTSSPLLSPTESLQNLTIDVVKCNNDQIESNKLTVPRTKMAAPSKTLQASGKPQRNPSEQKTGLRPPANWTSGNRPASGIPRPASRIPAPKFTRPNTKINQGDTKK